MRYLKEKVVQERLFNASCMVVIAMIGFALRVYQIGTQSFWEEELFSLAFYADKSVVDIIKFNIAANDPQPPLYFILLHFWTILTGQGEFTVRFLSLIAGVLLIPMIYQLSKELFGVRTGLFAAILAAINPFQIWYAQEARTYSLTALLTLISTVLLLRAIRSRRSLPILIGYAIITNLSIYSHYFSYFVVIAQAAGIFALWLMRRSGLRGTEQGAQTVRDNAVRPVAIALALVILPYLPWIPFAAKILGGYTGWAVPMSSIDVAWKPFVAFGLGDSAEDDLRTTIAFCFAVLLLIGLFHSIRSSLRQRLPLERTLKLWSTLFIFLYLVLPFVAIALFIRYTGRTIFHERYFIISTPAIIALEANGLVACLSGLETFLRPRFGKVLGLVLFVGLFITALSASAISLYNLYYVPKYQKADLNSAVDYIKAIKQDGDVILTLNAGLELVIRHYDQNAVNVTRIEVGIDPSHTALAKALAGVVAQARRIWFFPYWNGEADRFAETWLNENTHRVSSKWFTKARLVQYVTMKDDQPAVAARQINFSDLYETVSIALPKEEISIGSAIPISITWKPLKPDVAELRVALDLIDKNGRHYERTERTLQSKDSAAPGAGYPTITEKYGLQVPVGTPPGEYYVELRMLYSANGQNVQIRDNRGNPMDVKTRLGTVRISQASETSAEGLDIPHRVHFDLGDSLSLIGHDLPDVEFSVGIPVSFSLYWQANKDIDTRFTTVLDIRDNSGRTVAQFKDEPTGGLYPTTSWKQGEIVRDIKPLQMPPQVSSGTYRLVLYLLDARGRRIGEEVEIGSLRVAGRTRSFQMPQIEHVQRARIGDVAWLEGYALQSDVQNDGSSRLTIILYWRAIQASPESYKVFVHALNADGSIISQDDVPPMSGKAPTTSWVENEIVVDQHVLSVPQGQTVKKIRLGMYIERSRARLPITQAQSQVQDDSLILDAAVPATRTSR